MVDGSIVLVAKCPIPGKSKTRLQPLLGPEGSAALAKAMLSDILVNLTNLKQSLQSRTTPTPRTIQLILLYAPTEGRSLMESLLDELQIAVQEWILMPMSSGNDLQSSDLGAKLTDALIRARQQQQQLQSTVTNDATKSGPVVFLGMDSPETPLEEIAAIFDETSASSMSSSATTTTTATLLPADDGGYGMLSVPPQAPANIVFSGVRWSQSLTALSQLKALTDANIPVRIGRLMHDIDEPDDVRALVQRLQTKNSSTSTDASSSSAMLPPNDNLLRSSSEPGHERTSDCPRTRQVLIDYGLLKPGSSP